MAASSQPLGALRPASHDLAGAISPG
jgi:hypothetical protein